VSIYSHRCYGIDVSGIGKGGSTAEGFVFDPEIASLIHQLWKDPAVTKLMDHSNEFYVVDSAS
jgi:guanine nucleotide-binding protein subunit alpha